MPQPKSDADMTFVGSTPYEDEGSPTPEDRGDFIGEDSKEAETLEDTVPEAPEEPVEAEKESEEAENEAETPPETPQPEETEAQKAEEPAKKKIFVPKERFDRINERMQRAESELRAMQDQREALEKSQPDAYDFDDAEQKYADAVVNGQLDEAKRIRGEIRETERKHAQYAASKQAVVMYEQVAVKSSVEAAVELINEEFPVFNPKSSEYNQELVDEALELYNGWLLAGKMSPHIALVKAARVTASLNQVKPAVEEPARRKDPPPKKQASLEQKIKAANQIPPRISQVGRANSEHPDVTTLSEADFERLDDKTLRQLRGDFL